MIDDGFVVELSETQDANWLFMTRWLEAIVGSLGSDWDFIDSGNEDQIFYTFRRQRHAEQFAKVWAKTPLVVPYFLWEEFCQNDFGRARMNEYWDKCGWRPEVAFFHTQSHSNKRISFGPPRVFMAKFGIWFFESSADALLFWFEINE
jgi:hypothetical protein